MDIIGRWTADMDTIHVYILKSEHLHLHLVGICSKRGMVGLHERLATGGALSKALF